jgi:hypothetical protein
VSTDIRDTVLETSIEDAVEKIAKENGIEVDLAIQEDYGGM